MISFTVGGKNCKTQRKVGTIESYGTAQFRVTARSDQFEER